jgi:imidazolonepropionase-like amidohydrolase
MLRAGLAIAAIGLVPGIPAAAQEWDVQLPADGGSYPTDDLFIRNLEAVHTAAGPVLEDVSILIRNGIIERIGAGLTAPDGVRVIDGTGLTAMPGIVDEHSHTALIAGNEGTAPTVPEVRVLDALTTEDFGIYRALSGGVTTARIMHGSSNPIGGQSAVIKMRWGMDATEQLLIPGAPKFVKFALGENVTRKGAPPNANSRFPMSRAGVEAIYLEAFTAAQAYRAEWNGFRENPAAFPVPPRRDLRLEALVDIMEGRIRIHAHSYRADEILMLIRLAERFGFRIDVFTHVMEGYRVATEMAAHGAGGSTFSDWWQYKLEAYESIPHNAAIMHQHGVLTAINSDIPSLQPFMHREIVKPVKYGGVSELEALQMLTLNPARMMYLDDRVGSLEEGKEGDVVLLDGSPFDSFSRIEKTIVDGIVYYDVDDEEGTRGEPVRAVTDVVAAPATPRTSTPGDGPDSGPGMAPGTPGANGANGDMPPRPTATQEAATALVGATVHTVSGGTIPDGVVLIRGGTIEAVGARSQVAIPADAARVEVAGRHVYPGMTDPFTTLGLLEFGAVGQATDIAEIGDYNPHIRALAAVNPYYPSLNVARANGITTVQTAQGGGVVRGTGSVIQLNGGDTFEKVAVTPEAALIVDLPAGPEGDDDEEPELDSSTMEGLVDLFERAVAYGANPATSDDPTAPFEANTWGGETVLLEALQPALGGERPVFFSVDTAWEIRTLFVFLDAFPTIDAVVLGGREAYRVASALAARGIPVILTGTLQAPADRDVAITSGYRNAGLLHQAGVAVSFSTASDADVRNLPYHAALSVGFGLPEDAALRAVTLGPAEALGLDDLMGSIEPGKRADLLVTDGSPLQSLTRIERMWVGGLEVDPRANKHDRLWEAFRGR